MINEPFFSIVIPTRNRAHLLEHALRSALNQDFDDYEIIVVANNCNDNTKEVVQKLANSKVQYFETDKTLTMPENWEFAWTKAKGKYVTYLCDDDAIVPLALKTIAEQALLDSPPVISWQDAIYYYPEWNDKRLQNSLLLFNHGNKLVDNIPSSIMIDELAKFEFAWSGPIPKLLNCAVNRAFFNEWRHRLGKLFFPIAPDYSFAWISTQVCPNIRVINLPLSLRGISDYSIGSNAGLGEASQEFYREFGEFDFFAETKNDLPLTMNHLAATFIRVNNVLSTTNIVPKQIDSNFFHIALAKQLMECRTLLPNWEHHRVSLQEKAKNLPDYVSAKINEILSDNLNHEPNNETLRELHQRTREMALEYQPNIPAAIVKQNGDVETALCSLALIEEVLTDSNWSYLYLFGERIKAHNIFTFSLHVERYYDLLVRGKNLKQTKTTKKFSQNTYL